MKRFLLNIILLFFFSYAFSEGNTWVVLHMKNGITQSYLVPEKMIVKVDGDSLRLTSSHLEVTYAKRNIKSYSFRDGAEELSGIDAVHDNGIKVNHLSEDKIVIDGLPADAIIKMYSINGIGYTNQTKISGKTATISLQGLPRGTYLILIKGIGTIKILR